MLAGAVVFCGGAARASIGAEAASLDIRFLAFLLRLAQGGGTQWHLAELACEAHRAEARESSWEIEAAGSRGTRATPALVQLCLAVWSFEAWETLAEEGSGLVPASPAVGAGRAPTLVHVLLAPEACVSWGKREVGKEG